MAGIKETFSKGLTTINVKTNNFMESTTIKTHINTLESECKEIRMAIGESVYQKWLEGGADFEFAEEMLSQLRSKQDEIAAEHEKLSDLQKMEEDILGKKKQPQLASGGQIFCTNCGAANSSNHKFCNKCGTPLA